MKRHLRQGVKTARTGAELVWRGFVITLGVVVTLLGVALIVLPGPAFIVLPLGLALLATEFHWARRLLDYLKERFDGVRERWGKRSE